MASKLLAILFIMYMCTAYCCNTRLTTHGQFPLLYLDACASNYDLGLHIGRTFSSTIEARLQDSIAFKQVQAYVSTPPGRQLLAALRSLHATAFPAFYSELQGLAEGAGLPFDSIFMLNLRQEILAATETAEARQRTEEWLRVRTEQEQGVREGQGQQHADAATASTGEVPGPGQQGEISALQAGSQRRHRQAGGDATALLRSSGGDREVVAGGAAASRRLRAATSPGPAAAAKPETEAGSGSVDGAEGDAGDGRWVDPALVDACSDVAVMRRPKRGRRRRREQLGGGSGGRGGGGDDSADGPPSLLLVGHNEDMTKDTMGRMYYIRAALPGRAPWFALTYAGELPSTAFGANAAGVAFTLDALYPRGVGERLPGLGRNFLSRALLEAGSWGEAMQTLTREGQATGRSVNLMSTAPGAMGVWNVELGPGGGHDVLELSTQGPAGGAEGLQQGERELQQGNGGEDGEEGEGEEAVGWYFHANSYLRLQQPQKVDNSSLHRQARAAQFPPPASPLDVLALLGDTADPAFPIYRSGDYGGLVYTLCTALYDLLRRTLTVYGGNPREGRVESVLCLDTLLPLPLPPAVV